MAEKLVPGIPHSSRIAILQQTDADTNGSLDLGGGSQHSTVLERVMGSDTSRNEVIRKMERESFDLFQYIHTDTETLPPSLIQELRH